MLNSLTRTGCSGFPKVLSVAIAGLAVFLIVPTGPSKAQNERGPMQLGLGSSSSAAQDGPSREPPAGPVEPEPSGQLHTLRQATPIDLGSWTVIQYDLQSQGPANWVFSENNTVATQTNNSDASILLSDFDATNLAIDGTWMVNTSSDDDHVGFVFGYQDRGHYYLFDWKQADQGDPLGFSERGMSIKIIGVPGGADPTGADLWPSAGSPNATVVRHNTIAWQDFVSYRFHLEFSPGN